FLCVPALCCVAFLLTDTAATEIYTLSLHDALPISRTIPSPPTSRASSSCSRRTRSPRSAAPARWLPRGGCWFLPRVGRAPASIRDRKSTRLNSSHVKISYAVFCLKKKKRTPTNGAWLHNLAWRRSTIRCPLMVISPVTIASHNRTYAVLHRIITSAQTILTTTQKR